VAASDGRHEFEVGAAGGQPADPPAFETDSAQHVLSQLERYVASLQPGDAPARVSATTPGAPAVRGLRHGSLAPVAHQSRRIDSPLLPLLASRHSDLLPLLRRRLVGSDTIRPLHIVAGLLALAVGCVLTVVLFALFGSVVAAPTAVVAVAITLTLRDGTARTGFVLGVLLGVAVRVFA
jgi:hypothetical protein